MAKNKTLAEKLYYSEKVQLLYGQDAWTIRGNLRLHLEPVRMSDGPSGLRKVGDDVLGGVGEPATSYPCPALLACSFDTDLLKEVGTMIGVECKANGVDAILGPGVNIKRNPLCGRNFEYYSEDPYLAGTLASAFITGTQSVGVASCVKHFACNSQETYRMVNDSVVDERALNEIYLKPFQIAVEESSPWMVMASYNKVNGVYACENKELLLDTLKGKWKYNGVVISDWGGVNDPVLCHRNGLDVEMPCFRPRKNELLTAVRMDRTYANRVNDCAERLITLSQRVHNPKIKAHEFSPEDAHALAIKAAERSCVLVKNDGVLPIKTMRNVAVIGELATISTAGGGSSEVNAAHPVSFLEACRAANPGMNIAFTRGYSLNEDEDESGLVLDAVDLASISKKVILFVGSTKKEEQEGFDRKNLLLSHSQLYLIERIHEVCDDIVIVLCTGSPVETPFIDRVQGMLISYFPGEGGGEAIYRLLTGEVAPSGHLAETWVTRNYEVPSFGIYPGNETQSLYRESIYVGYRYYCTADEQTRFPFGFGLSYAKFRFSGLKVVSPKDSDTVNVQVSVSNSSSCAGDALVQVYVRRNDGKVFKAKRTLQAYRRVPLEPGEKKEIVLSLKRSAFEHYDVEDHAFRVEGGEYAIEIGESCEDIKLSAPINVIGDKEFVSDIDKLHVYYQPPRDGFWQYDDAFEALLGHVVPLGKDPRSRPFTLNSTIGDIASTAVGKAAISKLHKTMKGDDAMIRMAMEAPIRNMRLAGISDKKIQAVLDLANGKPLSAFVHLFVRKRQS